jgi:lipopolysaccharide biosynthesis glycosyltransferase/tetratricopeptide (TPR) repeat protein
MDPLSSKGLQALGIKLRRGFIPRKSGSRNGAKDVAVRTGAAELSFNEAARLCDELGNDLKVSRFESSELLATAQAAYRAHRLPLARQAIGEVISRGEGTAAIHLELGRVELRDGDVDAAIACFQKGIELDPSFAPCWIESAAAKRRLRRWDGVLVECLAFVDLNTDRLEKAHARLLREVADHIFGTGDRYSAGRIYACLQIYSDEAKDIGARVADGLLAIGENTQAYRVLQPLFEAGQLDNAGLLTYAVACSQSGRYDEAGAVFSQLNKAGVRSPAFNTQYLKFHYAQKDFSGAKAFLDAVLSKRPREEAQKLLFEFNFRAGHMEAALEQIESGAIDVGSFDQQLLIQFAYHLLSARELDKLAVLVPILAAQYGADPHIIALRMSFHFARQEWEKAEEVVLAAPAEVLAESRVVKLRCLELYAFLRDFDKAREYLESLGPLSSLPSDYLPSIVRYHAEAKDWQAVLDLLPLTLSSRFEYDTVGDVIVRACRRTGTHRSVVELIEGKPDWTASKSIKKLRAILLEDVAGNEDAIAALLADPHVVEFKWAEQRLLQKSIALRSLAPMERGGIEEKHTVFYCTNATYLCATAVSVYSLLRVNQNALARFDFHVVVDDDLHEKASGVFAEIGRAFGVTIEIVKASQIVESLDKLSGEYGIFTGGHSLAAAAFYRIFFAKYAREVLKRRRGLYIDSDTIVAGPILGLFETEHLAPLSARREVERPEVTRAVAAHGLTDGYFNSGVLLLDFASDRFARLIDKTIFTINDSSVTLMFHDQCALNIGFDGTIEPLDPKYNRFVDVGVDPVAIEADNVILHFLDRPKPWDPSYDGPASAYWFKHWKELASIIGGGLALELLDEAQ